MKKNKKITAALLIAAVLMTAVFMTGCSKRSEAKNDASTESGTLSGSDGFGVYVKVERDDVHSIYLHGGSFSKGCQNADGSLLKAGEWIFTGEDLAKLSKEENRSVLFTIGAQAADETPLGEASFLYDVTQKKLYVTIAEDGVTCSTSGAADAPADVPPVLTLPILDEINADVTVGTSGSSLSAVRAASKLLDWGVNTGLDTDEISDAVSTWLASQNDDLADFLDKLELVDGAYQKLLTGNARELLDAAGCENTEITWSGEPVEAVETIMQTAGLRG